MRYEVYDVQQLINPCNSTHQAYEQHPVCGGMFRTWTASTMLRPAHRKLPSMSRCCYFSIGAGANRTFYSLARLSSAETHFRVMDYGFASKELERSMMAA